MNYRFISSKEIIGKVYRDLKPNTNSWTADALEWIGEALDFIGYHGALEKKTGAVSISSFRGEIPCDLVQLIQVEYNGRALVYGTDTAMYDTDRSTTATPSTSGTVHTSAVYQTNPGTSNEPDFSLRTTADANLGTDYYAINGGFIVTSFEEGDIKLHYTGYMVDSDGFPMVPDNIYVKQAMEWYIIRQMLMGGYVHPVFDWFTADQKWGHYCVAAGNDMMFPSVDKMETMKNTFLRMIPNINAHADFFQGLETQQRLGR